MWAGEYVSMRLLAHEFCRRTSKEKTPGLAVTGDALEQRKRIADPVGRSGGELAGVEEGVDRDDLLE